MELSCSSYETISDGRAISNVPKYCIYNGSNNANIHVHDARYTDPETFKTAVSGQTVVYLLATPIEYTLTETQALTLLKGENNIWVDDSDSLELQYYAKAEETTP